MTDLRVMEIPPNKLGFGEGFWIRWPELRAVLLERGDDELAEILEATVSDTSVATREIKVRA